MPIHKQIRQRKRQSSAERKLAAAARVAPQPVKSSSRGPPRPSLGAAVQASPGVRQVSDEASQELKTTTECASTAGVDTAAISNGDPPSSKPEKEASSQQPERETAVYDSSDDSMDALTMNNPDINLVRVGTRVAVWWPQDQTFYAGRVSHIRKSNARPYYIEYEDESESFEWIHLRQHKFRILSDDQETDNKTDPVEEAQSTRSVAAKDPPTASPQRTTTRKKPSTATDSNVLPSRTRGDHAKQPDEQPSAVTKSVPASSTKAGRVQADANKNNKEEPAASMIATKESPSSHSSRRRSSQTRPSPPTKDDRQGSAVVAARQCTNSFPRTQRPRASTTTAAASPKTSLAVASATRSHDGQGSTLVAARQRSKSSPRPQRPRTSTTTTAAGSSKSSSSVASPTKDDRRGSNQVAARQRTKSSPGPQQQRPRPPTTPAAAASSKSSSPIASPESDRHQASDSPDPLSLVHVGARVAVWWPDDGRFYEGTITQRQRGPKPWKIEYDDSESEWINFRHHRFRLLSSQPENAESSSENSDAAEHAAVEESPDVKMVHVGSRVAVWWPDDRKFYEGTITERQTGPKPLKIEYDDNESEWINLRHHRFRLLLSKEQEEKNDDNEDDEWEEEQQQQKKQQRQQQELEQQQKQSQRQQQRDHTVQSSSPDSEECGVKVGSRVAVWWPVDHRYYSGTVSKKRNGRKPFFLEYDDGESEWINFHNHRFRLIAGNEAEGSVRKKARLSLSQGSHSSDGAEIENSDAEHSTVEESPDVSMVHVGSRVAVWWPDDHKFYEGTITQRQTGPKPLKIEYGDSESEWINLRHHRFRLLSSQPENAEPTSDSESDISDINHPVAEACPDVSLVNVGSRVAVWWPDDRKFYEGTITQRRTGPKPLKIDYDDSESEWINLRHHRFRLLSSQEDNPELTSDSESDSSDVDQSVAEASPDVSLIKTGSRVAVWWSDDRRYYKGTVTKERKGQKPFYLEYDDGDNEWIEFRNHRFRVITENKRQRAKRHKRRISLKHAGDDGDIEYRVDSPAKRQRTKDSPSSKTDDSDSENEFDDDSSDVKAGARKTRSDSTSKRHLRTGRVPRKSEPASATKNGEATQEPVKVGSRVSVWWPDDKKYYKGTVTRQRDGKKNLYLVYDDGDKEWINLRHHRFCLLSSA